jgi:glycosyltransferase involved in cell wall biosynthesis
MSLSSMVFFNNQAARATRSDAARRQGGDRYRVLIDTPWFFIGYKNTDWNYLRSLSQLKRFVEIEAVYRFDLRDILLFSLEYILNRLHVRPTRFFDLTRRKLSRKMLGRLKIDAVLNHSTPPLIEDRCVPMIWQYAILDPDMSESYGFSKSALESEAENFADLVSRADVVQLSTEAEASRHRQRFPSHSHRFCVASFFLPELRAIERADVFAKHGRDEFIEILFVGREGRRKGLDIVAEAISMLEPALLPRIKLTIVAENASKAQFNTVSCSIFPHLDHADVLEKMRLAHIYLMPSRFESFGLVFIEAMAAGCAVIAPNWEVQSEITNYGEAGYTVAPTPDSVRQALSELVQSRQKRLRMAIQGYDRFGERYAPEKVSRQYLAMVRTAMTLHRRDRQENSHATRTNKT